MPGERPKQRSHSPSFRYREGRSDDSVTSNDERRASTVRPYSSQQAAAAVYYGDESDEGLVKDLSLVKISLSLISLFVSRTVCPLPTRHECLTIVMIKMVRRVFPSVDPVRMDGCFNSSVSTTTSGKISSCKFDHRQRGETNASFTSILGTDLASDLQSTSYTYA